MSKRKSVSANEVSDVIKALRLERANYQDKAINSEGNGNYGTIWHQHLDRINHELEQLETGENNDG